MLVARNVLPQPPVAETTAMTSPTRPGPGPSASSGQRPPPHLERLEDGVDDRRVGHRQAQDVDGAGSDRVAQAGRAAAVEDEDEARLGQPHAELAQGDQPGLGHHAGAGDEDVDGRVADERLADGGDAGALHELGPGPQAGDGPLDLATEVLAVVEDEDGGDAHAGPRPPAGLRPGPHRA